MEPTPPLGGPDAWASTLESTLVYGADETGVSALAAGLALRGHGAFCWVDCARSAPDDDLPAHWILARGAPQPEVRLVEERLLRPPTVSDATVRQVVLSDGPRQERRLATYLALPELFQRMAARSWADDGWVAAVLANVDHLPPETSSRLLERRPFHELLHRAGIALFSTATAAPPRALSTAFDRVFRVEVPSGESWAQGTVLQEGSSTPDGGPLPVRQAWAQWRLDPTLLPLL
jgi:hypothetical protein